MVETDIKISVIIPIYNAQDFLIECLDSILKQTLKNIEVICIDDGSTDDSSVVLNMYREKDDRVRVVHQDNKGSAEARNMGLSIAKGEFICFMDADDYYPNESVLECLYNKAISNNALICGGSLNQYLQDKNITKTKFSRLSRMYSFTKEGKILYKDYQFDYGYTRFIYKTKLIKDNNVQFPNYCRFQDPPFFVRAMLIANEFYAIPMCTYVYRQKHKKIKWDDRRINDVVDAISDVIHLAMKSCCCELFWIAVYRLCISGYRWEITEKHRLLPDTVKRIENIYQICKSENKKTSAFRDSMLGFLLTNGVRCVIKQNKVLLFVLRMLAAFVLNVKYCLVRY
ncbi:glycosyltransferase family 2 protein [Butyrivibrio sp. AD3002]|uniref:glycosyltransferase family 2 protein n=1 Tax=Butyrivibrio sp. AD3002 TaxID=1280670 RepID=UPI0003B3D3D1|nr:glycosyltransferase family 2 protein [Butyrivibrio sp. AD3002]